MTDFVKSELRTPRPRASSPADPAEWVVTEDGYVFGKGDRVFNYYDGEWVYVREDPAETPGGWFWCSLEPDSPASAALLNSVRVSAFDPNEGLVYDPHEGWRKPQ